MPSRRRFLSLAVASFVLALAQAASAQESRGLRAGAAAVDITPTLFPVNMPGGFNQNLAEKAHDPLHARALVLDNGKLKVAMVVVDSLGVPADAVEEAKLLATRRCKILPENILISATHTHSAPPASITDGPREATEYRKKLIDGIAEAIAQADKRLRPAAVGAASHPLPDEVFNRRWFLRPGKMPLNPFGGIDLVKMNPARSPDVLLQPAGPTDPDVSVLSVQDAKTRRPLAIYANYSLHYVGGIPRAQVSADYYGEFARRMPVRVGARESDGFVAMMSNGTSGDINNVPFGAQQPRPPREPFEQIEIVARKAADAAWHARSKIDQHKSEVRLDMLQREITLKARKPTPELEQRAQKILDLKDEKEKAQLPRLAEEYARRTLNQAKAPATIRVPLQVIVVGDLAICAIPFETFAAIGLDLKKRSPFLKTLVVGLANGYNGYLPTPEQHKLGGYETWLGTNRVQEDASVIITDTLLGMLADLWKEESGK